MYPKPDLLENVSKPNLLEKVSKPDLLEIAPIENGFTC
jgi:hypothetical protein